MDMLSIGTVLLIAALIILIVGAQMWPDESDELKSIFYREDERSAERRGEIHRAKARRDAFNLVAGFLVVAGLLTLALSR